MNELNLSIVVPLYNEEESLPELHQWIAKVCKEQGLSYEIFFIDDGSTDASWNIIQKLKMQDEQVKGVRFKRNYGKSAALFTGFESAKGEVIITMDADLQDSPDEIPDLYRMIHEEGYDVISGWKKKRYDPFMKTMPSKIFNKTAQIVSGIKLHDFNCGLKAYRNEVVKSIEVYGEMHRYIPILAQNAGYGRIGEKVVQHQARKYGVTKFGLSRFVNGYLDLLSLWFMGKFGKKPMHFFGLAGSIVFFLGFLLTVYLGISKWYALVNNIPSPLITDTPYFYLAMVSMIIGSQLFLTGFVAELVTRNSVERNDYLIRETI